MVTDVGNYDGYYYSHHDQPKLYLGLENWLSLIFITGGPLDMRILGLVKTRISGKSHIENQKVVIPYVHDFSLICEIKITFAAVCLLIDY